MQKKKNRGVLVIFRSCPRMDPRLPASQFAGSSAQLSRVSWSPLRGAARREGTTSCERAAFIWMLRAPPDAAAARRAGAEKKMLNEYARVPLSIPARTLHDERVRRESIQAKSFRQNESQAHPARGDGEEAFLFHQSLLNPAT